MESVTSIWGLKSAQFLMTWPERDPHLAHLGGDFLTQIRGIPNQMFARVYVVAVLV